MPSPTNTVGAALGLGLLVTVGAGIEQVETPTLARETVILPSEIRLACAREIHLAMQACWQSPTAFNTDGVARARLESCLKREEELKFVVGCSANTGWITPGPHFYVEGKPRQSQRMAPL